MKEREYHEKHRALVKGEARKRSRIYPLFIGLFVSMIILNVAMLAINSM